MIVGPQTNNDSRTTSWQAFLHLLKGYIGAGCLGLPWAVTQLGLWLGLIACLLLGYLTSYNSWTVVELKRQLQAERRESTANRDPEAIITYPNLVGWLYGSKLERCCRICICVQQLAICTVFLSFVGANLHAVLEASFDIALNHVIVISFVLPAALALSLLRNLRSLAPVMAVATAMMLVAFALLIVAMAEQWPYRPVHTDIRINYATSPLALCAILYAYEGICLVLPIESSMANPKQFGRVFWTAMACSALLYSILSVAAVVVFGPVTSGSLTAFLLEQYAHDDRMKNLLLTINAFVSVSVLFTYPLQLVPALELIEVRKPLCTFRRKQRTSFSDVIEVEYQEGRFVFTEEQEKKQSPKRREGLRSSGEDEEERETAEDGLMMIKKFSQDSIRSRSDDSEGYGRAQDDDAVEIRTRICLVLATYLVAVIVPNIEILISLAGAVAGSCLALFMPPLLQIAARKRFNEDRSNTSVDKDLYPPYALVAIALVFMFIGTAASLTDIVHIYVG